MKKVDKPLKNYFYPLPSRYTTRDYNINDILKAYFCYDPITDIKGEWPFFIYQAIDKLYGRYTPPIEYKEDPEGVINFISRIEGLYFGNPYYDISDCQINLYTKKYNLPETFFNRDDILKATELEYPYCYVGRTKASPISLIVNWDRNWNKNIEKYD